MMNKGTVLFALVMMTLCGTVLTRMAILIYGIVHSSDFVRDLKLKQNAIFKYIGTINGAMHSQDNSSNAVTNQSVKTIVLWNSFFGRDDWGQTFLDNHREKVIDCPMETRCILSINRTDPLRYDAIIFHSRDKRAAPKRRSANQVYIMFTWESPAHGSTFVGGRRFYNWTATYSTHSDITLKYGQYFKLPKKDRKALKRLPQVGKERHPSNATVAWIVSNCGGNRYKYFNELKKYINIDVYGGCGKKVPSGASANNLDTLKILGQSGQYKFYLAFENSNCQDYITEKPFRALNASMVPVVMGCTTIAEYKRVLPENSFLDVRNFTSPKKLADHMKYLDTHEDDYLDYHAWRKEYWIQAEGGHDGAFCQICDALHKKNFTPPKTVNWGEFWNATTMCESDKIVNRIM